MFLLILFLRLIMHGDGILQFVLSINFVSIQLKKCYNEEISMKTVKISNLSSSTFTVNNSFENSKNFDEILFSG